jgi:co-chaperonin GroES (HSP10)
MDSGRHIVVIGDRVLVAPDGDDEKSAGGLYLPQGVSEKQKVRSGRVVKAGPGYIAPFAEGGAEPWQHAKNEPRYIPLQVKQGDRAIFLRREAIEIEYDAKKYLIVSQSAILAVVRGEPIIPDEIADML